MFSKSFSLFLFCVVVVAFSCKPETKKVAIQIPGVYHIRFETGNYWAGRENEIYFDYDSAQAKQMLHHFRYDDQDSIIYNKSYEVEKGMMDSVFIYGVHALRNERLFNVNKYEPKDVTTMRLEIIANERMLGCSYNNVLKPSLVSPEFGKLVKMINKCVGDSTFIK